MSEPGSLREREKELDFIYALAALLSKPNLSALAAAEGTAGLFVKALGHPERVRVTVSIGDTEASSPISPGSSLPGAFMEANAGDRTVCRIKASYDSQEPAFVFSTRERSLCFSATSILAVAAERLEAEERERDYRVSLENKNTVLSELLSRIELEKAGIRASIRERVDERIYPLVSRLARMASGAIQAGERAETEAPRLESRIHRELDAALTQRHTEYTDPRRRLSVRELEICDLVAAGLSSKQIAERLSIARSTVERHRYNVRRKLGLPDREGSIASAFSHTSQNT